jgi:hypothetical protein
MTEERASPWEKYMRIAGAVAWVSLLFMTVPASGASAIRSDDLRLEIDTFLRRELAAHLQTIPSLDRPPERIWGALTTGKFSWGTFMRALAVHHHLTGDERVGDRDLAPWIARMGLLEARSGGVTFAQLYPVMALREFGRDLDTNPVWGALSGPEREEWRKLLDVTRFYDPEKKSVGELSENYFGVAARIAAIAYDVGLERDRAMLDDLFDLAARPFTSGQIYADDKAPFGAFDRYSNEYARFLWVSATIAGREDVRQALRPSLKRQMRLWWDIVAPDGYSVPWGRSIGPISYMDTLEIIGFLGENPEFRPAPLPELASLFYQAWRSLRRQYRDDAHLLSVFEFGRGNYYYISREREWQQTTGFFGKVEEGSVGFFAALAHEGVDEFPVSPPLPEVTRFEYFRTEGRQAGVWTVRRGNLRFALPLTTGNMRPALSDYMPAPHGLPGFAAPVELPYPALTPFFELEDGSTIVATDGADEIEPASDGQSLKVVWRRFVRVGSNHGEWALPGFRTEVTFSVSGDTLTRRETFVASREVKIKRFWCAVPTTARQASATSDGWTLDAPEATLEVNVGTSWPSDVRLLAAARGAPFLCTCRSNREALSCNRPNARRPGRSAFGFFRRQRPGLRRIPTSRRKKK